jgi:hypothetical protein
VSAPALAALEIALLLTTGLVSGRSNARTLAASVLTIPCLAVPLALPAWPMALRFLMALASLFSILRVIEVRRDAREHGALHRMFAFVAPLDAFAITRAPARLDARGLLAAVAGACVGAVGGVIVWLAPSGSWRWPVAAFGCAVGLLGAMDALSAFDRALLRAVGIESPPVQDAPIRSRSVGELWGRRWNRAVGGWLRKHCFAPLARRRHVGLGVLASFAASAAIHFWPVLVAVGLIPALAMAAFFFVQALLVMIESRLGVARWPSVAAHTWTIGVMLASSPLFTVPILLVLGYR